MKVSNEDKAQVALGLKKKCSFCGEYHFVITDFEGFTICPKCLCYYGPRDD